MQVTSEPSPQDVKRVSDAVRSHNIAFMPDDFCELSVFEKDVTGNIIAGLVASTYWKRLDIRYLWVDVEHRGNGLSSQLLMVAENEAIRRGCRYAQVDTFDFQALGLYLKQGYQVFGELDGYENNHKRSYLQKLLVVI